MNVGTGTGALANVICGSDTISAREEVAADHGERAAMAGATFGVPMLCFPMGRDQPMVAERVTQLGIGSVASPEATALEIERAISEVLAHTGIKKRAREFADSVAAHPGLDDAVALLEQLLNNAGPSPRRRSD